MFFAGFSAALHYFITVSIYWKWAFPVHMWRDTSLVANTEKSVFMFWETWDVLRAAEIQLLQPMEEELVWAWGSNWNTEVHTSVFLQMNMKLIKKISEWNSLCFHMYCSSLWLMRESATESIFLTIGLDLVGQHDSAC